jgi:hypothetical protein
MSSQKAGRDPTAETLAAPLHGAESAPRNIPLRWSDVSFGACAKRAPKLTLSEAAQYGKKTCASHVYLC